MTTTADKTITLKERFYGCIRHATGSTAAILPRCIHLKLVESAPSSKAAQSPAEGS
jgi:hypothetical protein